MHATAKHIVDRLNFNVDVTMQHGVDRPRLQCVCDLATKSGLAMLQCGCDS